MKLHGRAYYLLCLLLTSLAARAAEVKLVWSMCIAQGQSSLTAVQDQKNQSQQTCSGMYGKKAWGGSVDPFILTTFVKPDEPSDAIISVVIYEWNDQDLIGHPIDPADPDVSGGNI